MNSPGFVLAACTVALAAVFTSAAEAPPIAVSVFYSAEDKQWPDTEKAIDAVAAKFPRLRIQKTNIDTDEGYKELAAAENRNLIKDTGDVTLVMGPLHLASKDKNRNIEKYFESMVERLLNPTDGKGRLEADVQGFAKDAFGEGAIAHSIPAGTNEHIHYFRVEKEGKNAGWIADVYRPITCPVCNDTQFFAAVDPELKVKEVRPVRELERYGAALDEKESSAFTQRFKDQILKDEVKVDGISGATKTHHAYENAVTEVLKHLKKVTSP